MSTSLNATPQPIDPPLESQDESPAMPRRGRLGLGSIVLLVGIAAVAVVFAVALTRQQLSQPSSGAAPDFTLETFDGQTIPLSELRGKVVMINFWASWCGPCRSEAPELQSAWEYYRDGGEVVFLGIAYADNGPRSIAFLEEFGVTYPNGPDLGTRISDDYHIQGVPETFIIDPDGNINQFIFAGVTRDRLITIIDGILAERSGT